MSDVLRRRLDDLRDDEEEEVVAEEWDCLRFPDKEG